MAKTTTETKYEATRRTTVITCDLCQAGAKDGWWDSDGYSHDEVQIESSHNTNSPSGGSYEKVIYDCCPACFKAKVVPALEALGLKPREEELDF